MELMYGAIIMTSNNININTNLIKLHNKITIKQDLYYSSIIKQNDDYYIYFRKQVILDEPEHEVIERYKVHKDFTIEKDNNFCLKLAIASHNFRIISMNDKVIGIGGQSLGLKRYRVFKLVNSEFQKYDKVPVNVRMLTMSPEINSNGSIGSMVLSPKIFCPFFANGLYMFSFTDIKTGKYEIMNNKLPVLTGIKEGRHDGYYGYTMGKNEGISVYDSPSSLLYNKKNKRYYIYQRANLRRRVRYVQYCYSTDLVNWSNFELMKVKPEHNLPLTNIYYTNLFEIQGVNNYIGIIPYNYARGKIEYFQLYYSNNCEDWNLVGIIDTHVYHKIWMTLGEPLIYENKYYFFCANHDTSTLDVYYIDKNRFSYCESVKKNELSNINFRLMRFRTGKIILNFETFVNGYIKVQLSDKGGRIIKGYSYNDFDIIKSGVNSFDYILSWNGVNNVSLKKLLVSIEGVNFKIYSIGCTDVY
jgi:hypothetical protein